MAPTGEGLYEGLDWLVEMMGFNIAKKQAKDLKESTSKTITDNAKPVTTGWGYALCGLNKMRNWMWGSHQKPLDKSASEEMPDSTGSGTQPQAMTTEA